MKLVVFGLTITSSWGNGHATLWRGLSHALAKRGHALTFFERDVAYYAAHRDDLSAYCCDLRLYAEWDDVRRLAEHEVATADAAIVTSYCPDARHAAEVVLGAATPMKVFYDMDTPVTLDLLERGEAVEYVPPRGLADFDLVLSFTGGAALEQLRSRLRARRVAPLYGSVDAALHRPVAPVDCLRSDLSYLGTYSDDRQAAVDALFLEPARQCPGLKFALAGTQYPLDFPWEPNIFYLRHLPPSDHAAFFCSSKWTLNVTRGPMAALGHCPSGRLFEAAACGAPLITDAWEGLDRFFTDGSEIVVARSAGEVVDALHMPEEDRAAMALRARQRVLDCHTSDTRALELESLLSDARNHGAGCALTVQVS